MGTPIALNANLPDYIDESVRRFAVNVAAIIDKPLFRAGVSSDAEGTVGPGIRRTTMQVRNRRGDALQAGFLVHLWFALTDGGPPQGAQTVTFHTGTVLETVVGGDQWRVLTDATGQVVMDVAVSGSATRFVQSFVLARIDTSDSLAWV